SGRDAMSVHTPKCPLREIYHHETLRKLQNRGIKFNFTSRVAKICCDNDSPNTESGQRLVNSLVLADGSVRKFDKYILAIPPYRAWKLLEESDLTDFSDTLDFGRFELGAITSLHLWFDRPVLPTSQRQYAILGGVGQWIFMPLHGEHEFLSPDVVGQNNSGVKSHEKVFYHQIVVSASHRHLSDIELTSQGSKLLVERALNHLKEVLPESFTGSNQANLIHSRVSTVYDAVFSPTPKIFRFRPPQQTPISNLALAGDWTQTDWPATMEGAVRSGQKAVEVLK
ncbi:MAG: FAD-dependent oxidoreductase, partial [Thermoguttaceae bacterium]